MTGQHNDSAGGTALTVANWNIHWMHDDHVRRADAIVDALRAVNPDVVCLQEAWVEGPQTQAARLAERIGLPHWSYLPVRELDGRSQGQAVLSRWPIESADAVEIPDEHMTRRALVTVLSTPHGRAPVVSTGLWGNAKIQWRLPAIDERLTPYRTIISSLQKVAGELPPIVGADLNAEPDSDELRWLQGAGTAPGDDPQRTLYLADVWRTARPDDPGYTVDSRTNPLVNFADGGWRCDYILAGELTDRSRRSRWAVSDCGLLGARHDGAPASDHYGLWARLEIIPETHPTAATGWRPSTEAAITGKVGRYE